MPSRSRWNLRRAGLIALVLLVVGVAFYFTWQQAIRPRIVSATPEGLATTAAIIWGATAVVLYLWRQIGLARARSKARRALTDFVDATRKRFDAFAEQTLGLAAVTLEWAVRAEMVRDDVEDVQEYMQQLAKRPGVRSAVVAATDGRIIAASDPRSRGRSFAEAVSDPPPESPNAQILQRPEGALRVVIPVMGLHARLGTLLVDYERPMLEADADAFRTTAVPRPSETDPSAS